MRGSENKTDPFKMIASGFTLSSSLNQTSIAAIKEMLYVKSKKC